MRTTASSALFFVVLLSLATLPQLAAAGQRDGTCAEITRGAALQDPCSRQMRSTAPASFRIHFATNYGQVVADCERERAPAWVDRVYNLAVNGYYNSNYFFRVIDSDTLKIVQFGTNGDPTISNVYNWESPALGECAVVEPQPPFMKISSPSLSNTIGTLSMSTSYSSVYNTTWNATAELFINLGDNSRLDPLLFVPICTLPPPSIAVAASFPSYGELADLGGPGPSLARLYADGNDYIEGDQEYEDMAKTGAATVSCSGHGDGEGDDDGGGTSCGPCEGKEKKGYPYAYFGESGWRCPPLLRDSCE